ncbi:pilus assembly protein PilM [Patescibacteria group bacterium]|nr:pilus assembly protein PilM [Patescibacteria group bacterium]MBU1563595.1 pilus assembly protein PilM [Patescibacteria group bacterium]MBU2067993.1 pilus assembly protein PilM [Patescibacteria group bacterium]
MFNFSQKPAFGLDLSDISLKAVQLEKKNGGLALIDFVNQEIPQGLVKEGEIKKEKELINLFKKTLGQTGSPFRNGRVVCNLPEEKVFTRIIQLPKMKESELEKAITWEADANIPLSINEVYLGWQIVDPIFEHIDHLDVLIAAAPRVLIDSYLSFLKKSGLKPIALEPESIAVIRSLMTKDDLTPSIVVDLGAVGTNFVIFSALAIRFTSHIDISGRLFNQSIIKELKVDEKEANKLKIEIGLDQKNDKRVYKALKPIINNLAKKIKSYISFYHEHATHVHGPDGAIGQVILCGGDSLLNNLPEVLTEKLGLPVKMGNPLTNLLSGDKKETTIHQKESFVYTTAIGLALRELL